MPRTVRKFTNAQDGNSPSSVGARELRETNVVNQLATHVPDLVLSSSYERSLPHSQKFEGILMFADISGFTALCERYSMDSRSGSGTDRLTKALNTYLGRIVENIISSEGDILKFAGDAFLALWKIKRDNLDFSIRRVIKCAIRIQERCDNWDTEVGVKLRVKIGLALGPMRVTTVGNQHCCHFVLGGQAVDDANKAEKFASSGSIILSPKIWAYCPDQVLITHEVLSDSRHIEVDEYLLEPPPEDPLEQEPENTNQAWNALLEPTSKQRRRPLSPWRRFSNRLEPAAVQKINAPSSHGLATSASQEAEVISAEDGKGRKRMTVFSPMTDDEKARLRKYIIKPVLQKIDDGLNLEYLSEMRQISVLFINLIFISGDNVDDVTSLQAAFQVIYRDLQKFEGCLNKIFMFDKGCTFLCMFGVPGYKHEDDCARALKCAYKISEKLKSGPNVSQVSIGVTTGSSFCGVVGHVHRHEYTVIGRKVNMAARLMMHYPNKVSCDPETYHHSKLPRNFFRQLPHHEMKGVRQAGVIHEYTEDENAPGQLVRTRSLLPYNEHTNVPEFEFPLLGREQEMNLFAQEMQQVIKGRNKRGKHRHVIVTQGEAGIGKSRFLDAAMSVAEKLGMRVICLALSVNEASIPYYTVRALFTLLLKMENCVGHLERERVLLNHIIEPNIREKLCLLNDLLILKFPPCSKLLHLGSEELSEELHHLLVQVVHKFTKDHCIVFTVDDAHFIDRYSWEFLNDLVEDSSTVCLLAIRPPSGDIAPPCTAAKRLISSRSTMHIKLRPMDGDHIAALACQMLDVISLPEELVSVLQEKCHGVPSWCEQILHDMLQTNAIELVPENSPQGVFGSDNHIQPKLEELQKRSDVFGTPQSSRRGSVVNQSLQLRMAETSEVIQKSKAQPTENEDTETAGSDSDIPMVCILGKDVKLGDLSIPDSMKGMILSRIDHLKPSEQLIVKCAAVLGMSFTRDMLKAIIPSSLRSDIDKFQNAIHLLIQIGIFECDSPLSGTDMKRFSGGISSHMAPGHGNKIQIRTECNCPKEEEDKTSATDENGSENLTFVSTCRNLKFTSTLLQETASGLLLADQKRKLHRRSAGYLEEHAHKCTACGSGQFIPSHSERQHQAPGSLRTKRSVNPSLFQQTARAKSAKTSSTSKRPSSAKRVNFSHTSQREDEPEQKQHTLVVPETTKKKGGVKFSVPSNASGTTIGGSSVLLNIRNKIKNRRQTAGSPLAKGADHEDDEDDENSKEGEEGGGREWRDEELLGVSDAMDEKRKSFINFRKSSAESTLSIISFEDSTTDNSLAQEGLNFDKLDFRECRCLEVLNTIFPQLVRHWRAAGNTTKTIHFLVEAGGAAIAMGNNMQALTFLHEASQIIEQLDDGQRPLPDDPDEHITIATEDRGKIASMIGQSYFQMGQMEESLPHFLNALKILKNKQPSSNIGIYLKTIKEAIVQLTHRTNWSQGNSQNFTSKEVRLLEQARCLSHIWHLHNSQNWSIGALTAALQQVNRAERACSDLEELINSYINMMECCQVYGWRSLGHLYEKLAMRRCLQRSAEVNFDNLVSIGRLYCVSLQTRLGEGRIQGAIDSGYSGYKIAEKLHDNSLELEVLPVLGHALKLAGRTTASVEVLEKLLYTAMEEEDVVSLCWYYCNCMDLALDTDHQLESFEHCLTFYQNKGTDQAFITNNTSQFYLVASFALWFCRQEDWSSAERWLLAAESIQPEKRKSLKALEGRLKLAECYLLGYYRLLTTDGVGSRETKIAKRSTHQYLQEIQSDVHRYPVTKPRFQILQLYYTVLSNGTNSRRRISKQVARLRSLGRTSGNELDSDWALDCENAWLNNVHVTASGVSKSSLPKSDNVFIRDGISPSWKNMMKPTRFTLPLPKKH